MGAEVAEDLMRLPRLQLFELEDLKWFPRRIRDFATDYLHFMETRFAFDEPIHPLLRSVLEETGATEWVDLCSGGGGPALALYQALRDSGVDVRLTLTDRYPNLSAFGFLASLHPANIFYVEQSVEATSVPLGLRGVRTIFNAFHHFSPGKARVVLESAVGVEQPICVFEISERTLRMMVTVFFTPVYVWLATPFFRPFRVERLLWTYFLPLIPLTCWWDGMVSQWRAYPVAEMLALTAGLDAFRWSAGRVPIRRKVGHVTYLVGLPVRRARVDVAGVSSEGG